MTREDPRPPPRADPLPTNVVIGSRSQGSQGSGGRWRRPQPAQDRDQQRANTRATVQQRHDQRRGSRGEDDRRLDDSRRRDRSRGRAGFRARQSSSDRRINAMD